jgi:hypothetical protein
VTSVLARRILLLGGLAVFAAFPLRASLYWNAGVRDATVSVCFVGDALTSRPARVAEVMGDLRHFEWAANVRFEFLGQCPAPTTTTNGDDFHDGDIRVVLPYTSVSGTGPVPGQGCPMFLDDEGNYDGENDGWGSWSNSPQDLGPNRPCLYNLKLGDDPWNADPYLNHTLHEFGHALGLAHEHVRNDVNAGCTENGYGGSASSGFLTSYDADSVMHYEFSSCGIDGNYGYSGLSALDRMGLHVLYPEADRVAELSGAVVLPSNRPLNLESTWQQRGAHMSFVAKSFVWILDGSQVGTGTSLQQSLAEGAHALDVRHQDFLGREYRYRWTILVLSPQGYASRIAATMGGPTSLP